MKLKQKEISKADMQKKLEAWKTINSVLVTTNAEFMKSLSNIMLLNILGNFLRHGFRVKLCLLEIFLAGIQI